MDLNLLFCTDSFHGWFRMYETFADIMNSVGISTKTTYIYSPHEKEKLDYLYEEYPKIEDSLDYIIYYPELFFKRDGSPRNEYYNSALTEFSGKKMLSCSHQLRVKERVDKGEPLDVENHEDVDIPMKMLWYDFMCKYPDFYLYYYDDEKPREDYPGNHQSHKGTVLNLCMLYIIFTGRYPDFDNPDLYKTNIRTKENKEKIKIEYDDFYFIKNVVWDILKGYEKNKNVKLNLLGI